MHLAWGIVLVVFTLVIGWLGQVINALSPALAARMGLAEPEADVDPAFFVDGRGEAVWDALSIWVLPAAGVLLILDNPWWPYFGLVGGGMYVYFGGRMIASRAALQRRGIRIGKPESVRMGNAALAVWGLLGLVTIGMALAALPLPQ